jgi:hypothetical protein
VDNLRLNRRGNRLRCLLLYQHLSHPDNQPVFLRVSPPISRQHCLQPSPRRDHHRSQLCSHRRNRPVSLPLCRRCSQQGSRQLNLQPNHLVSLVASPRRFLLLNHLVSPAVSRLQIPPHSRVLARRRSQLFSPQGNRRHSPQFALVASRRVTLRRNLVPSPPMFQVNNRPPNPPHNRRVNRPRSLQDYRQINLPRSRADNQVDIQLRSRQYSRP